MSKPTETQQRPTEIQQRQAIEAAQGYLILELPDAALRQLDVFRDPNETPRAVDQLRGEAFRLKEDYTQALECFERVLPHVEHDLGLLIGMAWCFKRIDRLDKALETMRQAYRGSPKEPIVLYNLACYHSLAGAKDEALSWLGRALRMDNSLRKLISRESDFDSLRNDSDFQLLLRLSECKERKKP